MDYDRCKKMCQENEQNKYDHQIVKIGKWLYKRKQFMQIEACEIRLKMKKKERRKMSRQWY